MASFTLTGRIVADLEVKRSRFRAIAAPVADIEAARQFIAGNAEPDASHHCWAWRFGAAYRFNDDGEPSGTAGKPILAAIDGQKFDGVAVLVIRWFGGILLGGGGLMRAYGGAAALALRTAERQPLIVRADLSFSLAFADLARVKTRLIAWPDLILRHEQFTEVGADLLLSVAQDDIAALMALISDLTAGRTTPVRVEGNVVV